jgi:hypothetical protein
MDPVLSSSFFGETMVPPDNGPSSKQQQRPALFVL